MNVISMHAWPQSNYIHLVSKALIKNREPSENSDLPLLIDFIIAEVARLRQNHVRVAALSSDVSRLEQDEVSTAIPTCHAQIIHLLLTRELDEDQRGSFVWGTFQQVALQ